MLPPAARSSEVGELSKPAEQWRISLLPLSRRIWTCSARIFLLTKMQMAVKPAAPRRFSSDTPLSVDTLTTRPAASKAAWMVWVSWQRVLRM